MLERKLDVFQPHAARAQLRTQDACAHTPGFAPQPEACLQVFAIRRNNADRDGQVARQRLAAFEPLRAGPPRAVREDNRRTGDLGRATNPVFLSVTADPLAPPAL